MPKRDPMQHAYELLKEIDAEDGASHDAGADLVLAAYFGDLSGLKRALGRGASPDARQRDTDQPALWLAVAGNHVAAVRALLAAGADPAITVKAGKRSFTPLDRAEKEGKVEIAELLRVALGGKPAPKGKHRPELASALGEAVWDRDAARVADLCRRGADPRGNTPYGEPLVAYAQRSGAKGVLQLLLDHGADPNATSDGRPILHDALTMSDVATVEALLAAGADPNAKDKKRTTAEALFGGDEKKRGKLLAALLARGLDPNSRVYDEPMLFRALRDEREDQVAALLAAGADVNVRIKHKVASFERLYPIDTPRKGKLLGMLLDGGLDVTDEKCCGNPLTKRLVFDGQVKLLDRVLTAGADPAAKSAGSTILDSVGIHKSKKLRADLERVIQKHLAARAAKKARTRRAR